MTGKPPRVVILGCGFAGLAAAQALAGRAVARRKHPLLLRLAAIGVYVALSIRLAQVIVLSGRGVKSGPPMQGRYRSLGDTRAPIAASHISIETEPGRLRHWREILLPDDCSQEDSIMWLRLRNLLMVVLFAWWTTSLIKMDPLMLEWFGTVLGG